ncbi:MAG: hypothetical protein ACI9IP_000050 [Arcticibacterium sp.]|jgi:hypothetical protein
MKTPLLCFSFSLIAFVISAQETSKVISENTSQILHVNQNNTLIYLNEGRLEKVKGLIKKEDSF